MSIPGELLSFEVKPDGDVLMLVSVPSEGIREFVLVRRSELAGMAEASDGAYEAELSRLEAERDALKRASTDVTGKHETAESER
jgi:hypothetical protein